MLVSYKEFIETVINKEKYLRESKTYICDVDDFKNYMRYLPNDVKYLEVVLQDESDKYRYYHWSRDKGWQELSFYNFFDSVDDCKRWKSLIPLPTEPRFKFFNFATLRLWERLFNEF